MFSYYGSKSKIVKWYPVPKYDKIIEPFAGSARYSLRFWQKDILLVDKYTVIVNIWKYLIQATENDILSLPKLQKKESIKSHTYLSQVEQDFLGFLVCGGVESPRFTVASFDGVNVEKDLKRIAKLLFKIRHWKIIEGDYKDIENNDATWFIDPPYQFGGEYYKESNKNLNFKELAEWCKSRNGQIIVCENTKADWMPFKPITKMSGTIHKTTEAIWSNQKTAYDNEQILLQF
jgi:site-specific DNA-adenine methylase